MRAILLVLIATPLLAQEPSPFSRGKCLQLFAEAARGVREVREEQGSALGASTVGPITSDAVAIVAGEAEGRGVISYARQGSDHTWSLKASAPFTKSTGESVFVTQDQLAGDLVITTGYTRSLWNLNIEAYGGALCTACEQNGVGLLQDCNASVLGTELSTDLLFGRVAAFLYGGEVSGGRKQREYFTEGAVAEKESRIGVAASIYGGLLFQQGSAYLRLTAKQDFKENDPAEKCEPADANLQKCKSLPYLQAKRNDTVALAAEGRYFFEDLAVAPSVSFEFQESDTTVLVPVFVLRNDASAFTGGIRLGWTTKNDVGFSAALFISKPLAP